MTNPFLQAFDHADFFGKMIFFALFFLSVLSWSVLIYKIWMIAQMKKGCSSFEKYFEEKKDSPLPSINDFSMRSTLFNTPYLEVYKSIKQKTVEVLNKNRFFKKEDIVHLSNTDLELIETHAVSSMAKESKIIEKNLFILPTVISLGPFLGLLGTVWGILITFAELPKNTLGSNEAFLSGLSMALATTVLGLLVAIPALVAHNYLKSVIREFKKDMENFSYFLLTTIEMQYRGIS